MSLFTERELDSSISSNFYLPHSLSLSTSHYPLPPSLSISLAISITVLLKVTLLFKSQWTGYTLGQVQTPFYLPLQSQLDGSSKQERAKCLNKCLDQLQNQNHVCIKNLSHSILTPKNMCAKLGKVLREHIIVHIRWRFGNLKKTYLSNPRLPKFEVWRPMFECYPATRSNIGRSNIGIIAIVPKLPMFEDWL